MKESFEIKVRPIEERDRAKVSSLLRLHWGEVHMVSRGHLINASLLPGFIAEDQWGQILGLITLNIVDAACEVVTLDAFVGSRGIGRILLAEAARFAYATDATRFWLVTTNDNVSAIKFYEKMGMTQVARYRGAVAESRRLKPSIPLFGENGIPIEDEIEFEMKVTGRAS